METIVITPPRRVDLPRWRELWAAREVAVRLAQRDMIVRYRQTILGVGWVLLQPLVSAGVFTIVFGGVAKLQGPKGIPYFVFSLAGMLAWNLFNGSLGRVSGSMVSAGALIQKVYFPRVLVPLSSLASLLVDFLVALGLNVVLLFAFHINPGWGVLLLPFWTLLALGLGTGIGAGFAAYMVKYRDIGYVLPWLTQILLYASPVAYTLAAVPDRLRWIFEINPVTWLLEAFRWSLLGTQRPPLWQMLGLVAVTLVVMLLGTLVFQRHEREFADIV